jgi:hypothetical protein
MDTKLSVQFIIAVTVITIIKLIVQISAKYKKENKLCINCTGVMKQDLVSVIIAFVFLSVHFGSTRSTGKGVMYITLLYFALITSVLMAFKIGATLISKMSGQTPVSIGAAAAAKPGAEAAESSTSVTEAKVKGAAAGANAAIKAAEDAGLTDEEVIEATIAGQVAGSAVAESVVQMK